MDGFWPQISPILPTGASHNDVNQSKYAVPSPTQTYVSITSHSGGHRRVSGELLNDFWTTYPKSAHFYPQISPILSTGASHNDEKQSEYAGACPNQTYIPITTHFGGHTRVSGELLNNFGASAPKLVIFSPNFTLFFL